MEQRKVAVPPKFVATSTTGSHLQRQKSTDPPSISCSPPPSPALSPRGPSTTGGSPQVTRTSPLASNSRIVQQQQQQQRKSLGLSTPVPDTTISL